MTRKILVLLLIFTAIANAYQAPTPLPPPKLPPLSEVDAQTAKAQRDFTIAKKMFNPYYAGPLLTPSAHNVPPKTFVFQPYLFIRNTYAEFTENRRSQNISDIWSINPVVILQTGLLDWLDFTLNAQAVYNTQNNQDSFNFGDLQLELGIQLHKEKPYRPAIRLTVAENFPTGKYKNLNPKKMGIDATGAGTYSTAIGLNFSKVLWWFATHPMSYRLSLNYIIPTITHVQGFNAYGGGYGTRGKIHPGNGIAIDTAIEFSFTQNWVLAIDLVYTYQNHSTFSGKKGRTATGATASVGTPSNDQFSAAPAIEYNPSQNLNFVGGVWFTITGRNSADFIAGVLSMVLVW